MLQCPVALDCRTMQHAGHDSVLRVCNSCAVEWCVPSAVLRPDFCILQQLPAVTWSQFGCDMGCGNLGLGPYQWGLLLLL